MVEQRNPLREWRERRYLRVSTAARLLRITEPAYQDLENRPDEMRITTDTILHIVAVTQIPLAVLVDYLTQKEVVSC